MKGITKTLAYLMATLALAFTGPAMAADYNLFINNGRVIDPESMRDEFAYVDIEVANVGIKDVLTAIRKRTPARFWAATSCVYSMRSGAAQMWR